MALVFKLARATVTALLECGATMAFPGMGPGPGLGPGPGSATVANHNGSSFHHTHCTSPAHSPTMAPPSAPPPPEDLNVFEVRQEHLNRPVWRHRASSLPVKTKAR